jgi:hypothetical protein
MQPHLFQDNNYTILKLLELFFKLAQHNYDYKIIKKAPSLYTIITDNIDFRNIRNFIGMSKGNFSLVNHIYLDSFKLQTKLNLFRFSPMKHYIYFDKSGQTKPCNQKDIENLIKRRNKYLSTCRKLGYKKKSS